jgi:hypothetical protein
MKKNDIQFDLIQCMHSWFEVPQLVHEDATLVICASCGTKRLLQYSGVAEYDKDKEMWVKVPD